MKPLIQIYWYKQSNNKPIKIQYNNEGYDVFTDYIRARQHLERFPRLSVYLGVADDSGARQITLAPGRKPDDEPGGMRGIIGECIGTYDNHEAWDVAMAHARML